MRLPCSLWGAANATMVIWNYVAGKSPRNTGGLLRSLGNITPGQLCRFFYTPDIQKAYAILGAVESLLIVVGYSVSVSGAIMEIKNT